MIGTRANFYKANFKNKVRLLLSKPSFLFFYITRLRKYSALTSFENFLISYPKSGRTWLQRIIIETVKAKENIDANIEEVSRISDYSASFPTLLTTHAGSSWEEKIRDLSEIEKDDIENYQHGKVIFLYRDPKDILVSQYYHIKNRTGFKTFPKEEVISNPYVGLEKVIGFMNKWNRYSAQCSDRVMALSYEALKNEPLNRMKEVFAFLGYDVSEEHIETAIQRCSIKRMKEDQKNMGNTPWSYVADKSNANAFQTRKGMSGEYREFFTDAEITKILSIIAEKLDPSFPENYFE